MAAHFVGLGLDQETGDNKGLDLVRADPVLLLPPLAGALGPDGEGHGFLLDGQLVHLDSLQGPVPLQDRALWRVGYQPGLGLRRAFPQRRCAQARLQVQPVRVREDVALLVDQFQRQLDLLLLYEKFRNFCLKRYVKAGLFWFRGGYDSCSNVLL